jgi:hypothetical protein
VLRSHALVITSEAIQVANWISSRVSRGSYRFPDRCADCLRPSPTARLRITPDQRVLKGTWRFSPSTTRFSVVVPFCESCSARRVRWIRQGKWLWWLGLGFGVGIAVWLDLGPIWAIIISLGLASPALWLMRYRDRVIRLRKYDTETLTFSFKSTEYAREFDRLNQTR